MNKPNPNLNHSPADMKNAVNAATLAVLSEISDSLNSIECNLRALALIAKDGVPGLSPETINDVEELLNDEPEKADATD
jgi:hypothetical protein